MHPHRPKLSEILAEEIRGAIATGRWVGWLPQERHLALELKTSRSTLRQALEQLRADGVIESLHSKGHRVVVQKPGQTISERGERSLVVGMLTPRAVDEGYPMTVFPLDDFRRRLMEEGFQLRMVESKSCYSGSPGRALEKLVDRNRVDCWILRLSTRAIQLWMQSRKVPAVILGSRHRGVNLPFVDVDRRAMGRHAVGILIQHGHRRLALVMGRERRGGDIEAEQGFQEAIRAASIRRENVQGMVLQHDGTIDGVTSRLERVMLRGDRPTALVVASPLHYLTIVSSLARQGIRVPEDVSLIAQTGTFFLPFLVPRPAFYTVDPGRLATKLTALVLSVARRSVVLTPENRIMPDFYPGDSVGRLSFHRAEHDPLGQMALREEKEE